MKFIRDNWKVFSVVILFSICFISIGSGICSYKVNEKYDLDYYSAKVINIKSEVAASNEKKNIYFTAKIMSGRYKNEIVDAIQKVENTDSYKAKEVKINDLIVINPPKTIDYAQKAIGEDALWVFSLHNTSNYLIGLILLFLIMIIIVGKWKGINTIISLIITTSVILFVYIPSILKGYNIYISTIIITIFIIVTTLLLINGYNKKTLGAIIGNIVGILISGLLAFIMNILLNTNGLINEDYIYLSLLNSNNPISLRALIWGGIIIGSLGAIMDVAMAISSSINELNEKMKNKSFSSMFKSGMNIGKDAIGTMTNTLILAYIGCSIATVLLLFSYNKNVLYLFNIEMITVEVLQAIVGSIGILCTVPVTALFCSWIFNKK